MRTFVVVVLMALGLTASPTLLASATAAPELTPPTKTSAGGEHSCAIRSNGSLWCWGRNTWGQAHDERTGPGNPDPNQYGTAKNWSAVSAGGGSTCGVRTNNTLWCWGVNHRGQIGDGTRKVRTKPVQLNPGKKWARVSAGWSHTCALTTSAWLWCWGNNAAGQLGVGGTADRLRPALVGGRYAEVSATGTHTCAVRLNGSLWCWGRNTFGQLGTGDLRNRTTPTRVGDSNRWAGVTTSWTHTCGWRTSGRMYCWGRNNDGQLGEGSRIDRNSPQAARADLRAVQMAASEGTTCARKSGGDLVCWGSNIYGAQGAGIGGTIGISGGWMHFCAKRTDGQVNCWGHNSRGQLGNGTFSDSGWSSPVTARSGGATARTGTETVFTIGSMNALGAGHSRPYSDADQYAPVTVRARWTGEALATLGPIDIIGMQETDADHLRSILKGAGGKYTSFPRPSAGDLAVTAPLLWRTSQWEAVEKFTITTQFISRELKRPVVKLRNKQTGRQIWVMNVHNAPWEYQSRRNEATTEQLAKIRELRQSGVPVYYIGDFNEKATIVCKVLRKSDLYSPLGGYLKADGTCVPPEKRMRVDWIFGSKDVAFPAFKFTRPRLVKVSTDHHVAWARTRLR